MIRDTISILDGSTFFVGDARGGIDVSPDEPHGFAVHVDLHPPDKIERIESAGIPGRWGSAEASSAAKEAVA